MLQAVGCKVNEEENGVRYRFLWRRICDPQHLIVLWDPAGSDPGTRASLEFQAGWEYNACIIPVTSVAGREAATCLRLLQFKGRVFGSIIRTCAVTRL